MKIRNGKKNTKSWALLFFLLALASPSLSQAQAFRGGRSFKGGTFESGFGLRGIRTYAGMGFADFEVKSPASNFRMDQGVYAFIGGERDINESGTSVTISFNYLTTQGQSFYDYSTLGGARYTGADIGFDSTNYQLGLGFRQRFFPQSWLRPYVEGGGLFGYHEIKYTDNINSITQVAGAPNAADFKRDDALVGFGYYGEAGLEIDFSDTYGVKVGGRYQMTETRAFETLGDQKVKFETLIFQLGLVLAF